MKINIFLKILLLIIISIIIFFISCDVLTKMNEQEWNEINLEEEEKKEIFIYVTGYVRDLNADTYTVKYNSNGNQIWARI